MSHGHWLVCCLWFQKTNHTGKFFSCCWIIWIWSYVSKEYRPAIASYLWQLIQEHHTYFCELYPECSLTPKLQYNYGPHTKLDSAVSHYRWINVIKQVHFLGMFFYMRTTDSLLVYEVLTEALEQVSYKFVYVLTFKYIVIFSFIIIAKSVLLSLLDDQHCLTQLLLKFPCIGQWQIIFVCISYYTQRLKLAYKP